MNILVACEQSGRVRDAFIKRGHKAYSNDLEGVEVEGLYPDMHLYGDTRWYLNDGWDMIIAFPPCTHLAVSGARYFAQKRKDGRQQDAIEFFMDIAEADCPKIAIENPVGIMSTVWRKPDQIIQPYEFGDDASKKTCLWLKGLPLLVPTKRIKGRMVKGKERWANQTGSGQNRLGPSADRAKLRSETYPGISKAMAKQWG